MPASEAPHNALGQALSAIGPEQAAVHADNLRALLLGMATYGNRRADPVRTVPGILGDRWSSLVMHLLNGGMLRHTELRRLICLVSAEHDISQRMLTLKLRGLERDGLITRQVTDDLPPRVEYRLSALGRQAYAHFAALLRWAEQATAAIRDARADYDRRHPQCQDLLAEGAGTDDD